MSPVNNQNNNESSNRKQLDELDDDNGIVINFNRNKTGPGKFLKNAEEGSNKLLFKPNHPQQESTKMKMPSFSSNTNNNNNSNNNASDNSDSSGTKILVAPGDSNGTRTGGSDKPPVGKPAANAGSNTNNTSSSKRKHRSKSYQPRGEYERTSSTVRPLLLLRTSLPPDNYNHNNNNNGIDDPQQTTTTQQPNHQNNSKRNRLKTGTADIKTLEHKISWMEAENQKLKEEIELVRIDEARIVEHLNRKLEDKDDEVARLEDSLMRCEADFEQKVIRIRDESESGHPQLRQDILKLSQDNKNLSLIVESMEDLEKDKQSLEAMLDKERTLRATESDNWQRKLIQTDRDNHTHILRLKKEMEMKLLEQRAIQKTEALKDLQAEMEVIVQDNRKLMDENTNLSRRIDELEKTKRQLQMKLDSLVGKPTAANPKPKRSDPNQSSNTKQQHDEEKASMIAEERLLNERRQFDAEKSELNARILSLQSETDYLRNELGNRQAVEGELVQREKSLAESVNALKELERLVNETLSSEPDDDDIIDSNSMTDDDLNHNHHHHSSTNKQHQSSKQQQQQQQQQGILSVQGSQQQKRFTLLAQIASLFQHQQQAPSHHHQQQSQQQLDVSPTTANKQRKQQQDGGVRASRPQLRP